MREIDYQEHIQNAINYIEEHLTDEISNAKLAQIAGYSEKRPVSEIAFEYGFNSKENFTRAFKAEHHILPTEFKTARNSLKPYDRITFDQSSFRVHGRAKRFIFCN